MKRIELPINEIFGSFTRILKQIRYFRNISVIFGKLNNNRISLLLLIILKCLSSLKAVFYFLKF